MKLERLGPARLRVTLHAFELATLTAAARWAAEGGDGELAPDARKQLVDVLDSYDSEVRRLNDSREPETLTSHDGS
ncbi:MAG: hypothetical protein E6I33_06195 [Chloroflexi bacterium]|nr:MAG: hypothetical protein E6I55_05100 [Chloroflexota bacterium]TMF15592.1 MAG: hypothetical protein E6I33_06195 [Chloroflexota bacterium]